jgi:MFS family permease
MKSMSDPELLRSGSAWAPLRKPFFRALWISSLTSSIGTWMHEVGAAWLMTSLTLSPMMVALLHTAGSLPMFLLALPAGAIADMWDRRKILLFTQGWMLASAAVLCVVTVLGAITPWLLLILTFALGVGAAMNAPAWQSTTPEFVPAADIPAAVALTGLGLNIARAVGPAIGGAIVKAIGAWAVFLLNAASFLGVIVVLSCWRGASERKPSPARPVMNNIGEGIRYALQEPGLRAVLVRVSLFVPFASALWALVPLLARYDLELNCSDYGALFGCLGIGSVIGAVLLPKLRCHFATDTLVGSATILFAGATAALAQVRHFGLLCLVLMVGGIAWVTLMSSFNVATQMAVPSWIRARALALYLLVFHGGMAVGSVLWGALTERAGLPVALLGAAAGMVVSVAAIRLCPLPESGMSPTTHQPESTGEYIVLSSMPAGAYGHRSNMGSSTRSRMAAR